MTVEIPACLKEGTPAGEYSLTLTEGELVDLPSGRAIHPELLGGKLTVLSPVQLGAVCRLDQGSRPPEVSKPFPNAVNAQFKLTGAQASPGSEVVIPLLVRADEEIQGFEFVVDFDEEVLTGTRIEKLYSLPKGDGFDTYYINNENVRPGNAGVDEGYLAGAAVFSLQDNDHNLPANKDNPVVNLHFLVKPDTKASSTVVRFLDGADPPNMDGAYNSLTTSGNNYTPDTANSFVFLNGIIDVLPEISTFVRGDSNGDETVNLSDAVHTLGYLFLGSERPVCYDAADADDDGEITIGDPLFTLTVLFLGGGKSIPPPYPVTGEDPTVDKLGCLHRS